MSDPVQYHQGELYLAQVAIRQLATQFETPFYAYSKVRLIENIERFQKVFGNLPVMICYAVKANNRPNILQTMAAHGLGADVVSGGEITQSLAAGIPAGKIAYSGVGKSLKELTLALSEGIAYINAESIEELGILNHLAGSMGKRAQIVIRVNPDVNADTHHKISTGRAEHKFGIDHPLIPGLFAQKECWPFLDLVGLGVHIGSQILDLAPYDAAYRKLADMVWALRFQGHTLSVINLGGGLGVPYRPKDRAIDLADYAALIQRIIAPLDCQIVIEPGRSLVADTGILVTQVLYTKQGTHKKFVIVDAGMNDLIRPTLYDAYHEILPIHGSTTNQTEKVDVVGPICETGDFLALNRNLPPLKAGDLLVVKNAGAYGAVMASSYNSRSLPAEVWVENGSFTSI